jgi:hypothetical protein
MKSQSLVVEAWNLGKKIPIDISLGDNANYPNKPLLQ